MISYGSDATIEATVVRSTAPQASDGHLGYGLELRHHTETDQRGTATIRSSLIEGNTQAGVAIADTDVTIESTIVRDVLAGFQGWGAGIAVDDSPDVPARTRVEIRGCVVERTIGFGVEVLGADLVVEGTRVAETAPLPDGRFGDGVAMAAFQAEATTVVTRSLVENNGRAGITSFGGFLTLGATTVWCNPVDIAGEVLPLAGDIPDRAPTFDDQGDNVCGCAGATIACAAEAANLEPPPPIPSE